MWIELFSIVFAVAVGFGLGAVMLETNAAAARRYGRKAIRH
jgi:hypothetical protein